jgi:hypothetical protein
VIWQRSCLYRLWVVGGLLAVVAVVVNVGVNTKPGDEPPYVVLGGAVGVYLLGIIVMQAVDLGRKRPAEPLTPGGLPQTQEHLVEALRLPGASAADPSASRRFNIALFIPTALVAILLPLGGYLYISGQVTQIWQPFGETGIGIPVAALPGLAVVLVLALMLPVTMKRGRQISDDYFAGTGLRGTAMPTVILVPRVGTDGVGVSTVGPSTMEGERYGRHVVVDMYAGRTAVLVQVPSEPFEIAGGEVSGPAWVGQAWHALPDDRRLAKVRIAGSSSGVRADRRGSAVDGDWMLDLWLVEYLLQNR